MKLRKCSSLALALLLIVTLALPAAASTTVTYASHDRFTYQAENTYNPTDLFENFKDIMPGDVLHERIYFSNRTRCCDYIKVYFTSADQEDSISYSSPGKAGMTDFMSRLELTLVCNGEELFQGKAGDLFSLEEEIYLGRLRRKERITLDLTLEVPIELGNEYANQEGNMGWVFIIEEFDDGSDVPKTGDHMVRDLIRYVTAMAVSAAALLLLILVRKKSRKTK